MSQMGRDDIRRTFVGPMSQVEIDLVLDMCAFLQYAIRNGMSFPMAISTVLHDANRVAQLGFSLEAMSREQFQPKVAGYSHLSDDSVGQSDEASDAA